ncbi:MULTISPECIES: hypothetical protein [Mycolicibacterium]|nr:hypothetical protein [Mycolicibacterium fortuitum]
MTNADLSAVDALRSTEHDEGRSRRGRDHSPSLPGKGGTHERFTSVG